MDTNTQTRSRQRNGDHGQGSIPKPSPTETGREDGDWEGGGGGGLVCERDQPRSHKRQWSSAENKRGKGISTTPMLRPAERSEQSEQKASGLESAGQKPGSNDGLITELEFTEALSGLSN